MKLPVKTLLLMTFFLLVSGFLIAEKESLVHFKSLDISEASASGKKIMVSFTADWCLPCKLMKTTLYSDPEIANLVNSNFEPVLIDVETALGDNWNKSYNIDYLPSVLFTDATGIEFERLKKIPTKEEFIKTLTRIVNTPNAPFRGHNPHRIVSPKPVITKSPVAVIPESSWNIQLGAFSTFESAEKRIKALAAYREENYVILQETRKEKILYKVVHTGSSSKEKALSLLGDFHQNGFEGFLRLR